MVVAMQPNAGGISPTPDMAPSPGFLLLWWARWLLCGAAAFNPSELAPAASGP